MKVRNITGRDGMLNEYLEYFHFPRSCVLPQINLPVLLHQVTVFLTIRSVVNSLGNEGLWKQYQEEILHVSWVFNFCFLSLIYSIESLHDLIILNSEGVGNSMQPCRSYLKTSRSSQFCFHKCQNPTSYMQSSQREQYCIFVLF